MKPTRRVLSVMAVLALGVIVTQSTLADVIVLKSGKRLEGKVKESGDLYSLTEPDGTQLVIPKRLVKEFIKGPAPAPKPPKPKPRPVPATPPATQPKLKPAAASPFEPDRLSPEESAKHPSARFYANRVETVSPYDPETRKLRGTRLQVARFGLLRKKVDFSGKEGRIELVKGFVRIFGVELARKVGLVFYDGEGKAAYCWLPPKGRALKLPESKPVPATRPAAETLPTSAARGPERPDPTPETISISEIVWGKKWWIHELRNEREFNRVDAAGRVVHVFQVLVSTCSVRRGVTRLTNNGANAETVRVSVDPQTEVALAGLTRFGYWEIRSGKVTEKITKTAGDLRVRPRSLRVTVNPGESLTFTVLLGAGNDGWFNSAKREDRRRLDKIIADCRVVASPVDARRRVGGNSRP